MDLNQFGSNNEARTDGVDCRKLFLISNDWQSESVVRMRAERSIGDQA